MLYQDDSRNQFPPSPTGFVPGKSSSSGQYPPVIPRFNISLEAPTAILDTQDEVPLTYINRGQFYTITLNDTEAIDGEIESTIILMFHDDQQRRVATSFWRFWLGQQSTATSVRAIDIDKESSRGTHNIVYRSFDRITFNWIGKYGARIFVRFNCLSTDFSRIKGVKGIPLRIHVESRVVDEPGNRVEKSICRARIFRDKGAQRKAKDERRHIEKQIEKLRVENQDLEAHPLWHLYTTAETSSNTIEFSLFSTSSSGIPEPILPISQDTLQAARMQAEESALPVISHVSHPSLAPGFPYIPQPPPLGHPTHPPTALDIDPSYLPRARRQTAVLNIFIRFAQQDPNFRAVYLQNFTVEDLVDSICQKININPANIVSVIRLKGNINIAVDDQMVEAMREEQSMEVDYDINPDGSLTLLLSY